MADLKTPNLGQIRKEAEEALFLMEAFLGGDKVYQDVGEVSFLRYQLGVQERRLSQLLEAGDVELFDTDQGTRLSLRGVWVWSRALLAFLEGRMKDKLDFEIGLINDEPPTPEGVAREAIGQLKCYIGDLMAEPHSDNEQTHSLTHEDIRILETLANGPAEVLTQVEIAEKVGDRKAVGKRLRMLRDAGYVDHPSGKKKGNIITQMGKEVLSEFEGRKK